MSKPNPLETLIELAQGRVDDATRRLGQLLAGERSADERLRLLTQYRMEYRERYLAAARQGIGPDGLRNFTAFIGKLDEAIAQQQQVLEEQRRATQAGQQQWMSERNRLRAFDTLSQRQQQQEQQRENRLEQRQSDEHAAKQFRPEDTSGIDGNGIPGTSGS